MEKLETAKELAVFLGVAPYRIYVLCKADKNFPVVRLGKRQLRFARSAVIRWIERGGSKLPEGGKNAK